MGEYDRLGTSIPVTPTIRQSKIDTVADTPEEHVYVTSYGQDGRLQLWEFDLLGVRKQRSSDGNLPPIINIECPACTTPHDRAMLSITYENRPFELEELSVDKWHFWAVDPNGGVADLKNDREKAKRLIEQGVTVFANKMRLTVKDTFGCDYCGARYRLTDNHLTRVSHGYQGVVVRPDEK